MTDPDLQRTLQSLACAKFRILTKIPKGRDVNPTDKFSFNESFTSPLARVKIMQVSTRVETNKEREETQEMVEEERKHMVEVSALSPSSTPGRAALKGENGKLIGDRRALSG